MNVKELPHALILHIGDIHYPETSKLCDADEKDTKFPSGIAEATFPKPLDSAFRTITEICENGVNAIVMSGDLTSGGPINKPGYNLIGYKNCVSYLHKVLKLGVQGLWRTEQVHVVPGNHDVVRELSDPDGNDWKQKFAPLALAWSDIDFPILGTDAVREVELKINQQTIKLYSANSCIGCGVIRSYAPELREALSSFIQQQDGKEDAFRVKGELLDTPAFEVESIQTVAHQIKELDKMIVPIVVAHHNLLPQANPRVAPYAELMNGGLVRTHLANAERFVLYCHGHVHDNPVEIISNAIGGMVVCVSAKMITEGFNTIRIETSLEGKPLGCIITQYEKTRGCDFQPQTQKRIAIQCGSVWSDNSSEELKNLINILNPVRKNRQLFCDVARRARDKLGMGEDTLQLRLLEAEWLGVVELSTTRDLATRQTADDVHRWQIRRL